MRMSAILGIGAAFAACAICTSEAVAQGKPERSMSCTRSQSPLCDVSCVTVEGTPLFVFDRVQAVFVSEFAGNHTLLEIPRSGPSEIVSVLVGNISHCTFNGLQDPSLSRGKGGGT